MWVQCSKTKKIYSQTNNVKKIFNRLNYVGEKTFFCICIYVRKTYEDDDNEKLIVCLRKLKKKQETKYFKT